MIPIFIKKNVNCIPRTHNEGLFSLFKIRSLTRIWLKDKLTISCTRCLSGCHLLLLSKAAGWECLRKTSPQARLPSLGARPEGASPWDDCQVLSSFSHSSKWPAFGFLVEMPCNLRKCKCLYTMFWSEWEILSLFMTFSPAFVSVSVRSHSHKFPPYHANKVNF